MGAEVEDEVEAEVEVDVEAEVDVEVGGAAEGQGSSALLWLILGIVAALGTVSLVIVMCVSVMTTTMIIIYAISAAVMAALAVLFTCCYLKKGKANSFDNVALVEGEVGGNCDVE